MSYTQVGLGVPFPTMLRQSSPSLSWTQLSLANRASAITGTWALPFAVFLTFLSGRVFVLTALLYGCRQLNVRTPARILLSYFLKYSRLFGESCLFSRAFVETLAFLETLLF
jgi:hypothetical protein